MVEKAVSARSLFQAGAHCSLIEQFWDCEQPTRETEALPYVIGSLSFLGRISEAEILLNSQRRVLEEHSLLPFSVFFVALGHARSGDLERARTHLLTLVGLRKAASPLAFWFFQGLAFLRYIQCRFGLARRLAAAAHEHATSSQDFYARALASDLLGHALIATGEVFIGIKSLEQALAFFQKIGNQSHSETLRRSLATYRAKHSVQTSESLANLEAIIDESHREENNFSLAGTYLEITRIYCLIGQLKKAEEALDRAAACIHGGGLEIHADRLDMRRAHVFLLRGQARKALRTLQRVQPKAYDLKTQLQLSGLRRAVGKQCGIAEDPDEAAEHARILRRTQDRVGQRIENRGHAPDIQNWGKDPLGDLLDELHHHEATAEEKMESIARHGFWSFAYEALGLDRTVPTLVFNALPGTILVLDQGEVGAHALQMSSQLHRCFDLLARGELSKEELVRELWGYDYHPLRHDPLIYGLISRVRAVLGSSEHWLIAREQSGYSLAETVRVVYWESTPRTTAARPDEDALIDVINQRQRKIMRYLDQHESIDVQTCVGLFADVSKTTLTRDLSQLVELQYLKKVGKARNTSYMKQPTNPSEVRT